MIPREQLRESSFYQLILDEGRQEGRQEATTHFFRQLVAKRFPGLQLNEAIEAVASPDLLEQLACELDELPDAEALLRRLAELTGESSR